MEGIYILVHDRKVHKLSHLSLRITLNQFVSPPHLTSEKLMLKYHGVCLPHTMRLFQNPKST